MSHLKADAGDIVESRTYTAADYKGDPIEWVQYAYIGEVVALPPGVEVTDDSYTRIGEDGQATTIFYAQQRFYKLTGLLGDEWRELLFDTVRKTEWDAEHEHDEG